jgi:hypothetical protein
MSVRKFFSRSIFKNIKVFDIIVVILLGLGGVTFFLFFYRKAAYVNIRVKVTDQEVLYQHTEPHTWYANRFRIGDAELDVLGRKTTEVIKVQTFNVDSQNKAVYLDLKVRATYDSRSKTYSSRGQNIVFGAPIRINLSNITFDGFVTEFPGSEDHEKVKTGHAVVEALGRSAEPAVAQSIKKGDQIFDSNNNILAEIIDVQTKPAEQVTQTSSGDLLLKSNPLYLDMSLKVKVSTKSINGELFMFDNLPVKIGDVLPLNLGKVSIFPMITSYELQ